MDSLSFQHRLAIETIRDNGGEMSTAALADELDITRDEAGALAQELRDANYLCHTKEFDWGLNTQSVERFQNHPHPSDLDLERDPEEVVEKAVATIAYPYASGSELSARRFARWLVGMVETYSVSGVGQYTLTCGACDWTATNHLHYSRTPKFCPECGEPGAVEMEEAD